MLTVKSDRSYLKRWISQDGLIAVLFVIKMPEDLPLEYI